MRIEWDNELQQYRFDGQTSEQISDGVQYKDDTLQKLGALNIEDEETYEEGQTANYEEAKRISSERDKNLLTKADELMGYVSPQKDKEYEKLSVAESWQDVGNAVRNEASHLWQKKEDETQYEARTQLAENFKYLYRYGAGILGFGKIGVGLKAAGLGLKAAKLTTAATKLTKAGNIANKIFNPTFKFLNVAEKDGKLLAGSKKLAQIMSSGAVSGMWADFVLSRPEEGEGMIGDIFGETDNPLIKFFQTDVADSGVEYRAKKMLEGMVLGGFTGLGLHALGRIVSPLFSKVSFIKELFNATTEDEALNIVKKIDIADSHITNTTKAQDLIDKVTKAYNEAEDKELFSVGSLELTQTERDEAEVILERLKKGQTSLPSEDGRTVTEVKTWQDAADVSPEELKRQLTPEGSKTPDGINLMDKAVEDTLRQRGVIREGEKLVETITKTVKGVPQSVTKKVNTKLTEDIKLHFLNKWGLGDKSNKIKITWSDGKTASGKEATSEIIYKKVKNVNEEALSKAESELKQAKDNLVKLQETKKSTSKSVQYAKLTSKINKLEEELKTLEAGGDTDRIATKQEQIKQAKLDLAKLMEEANSDSEIKAAKDKIKTIKEKIDKIKAETKDEPASINIKIDQNTKNPYAVIRSELEHVRDEFNGTTPKDATIEGSGVHFSRYKGDNESEASVEYVKHKADKYKEATQPKKEYKFESRHEEKQGINVEIKSILDEKGKPLAEIQLAQRGEDFEIRLDNLGVEKGAARKALAEAMKDYPTKEFYWKAINDQSVKSYNYFVKEYPELADRIKFFDVREHKQEIDNVTKAHYDSLPKRASDEIQTNSSEQISKEYVEQSNVTTDNRTIETFKERAGHITSNQQADDLLNEFVETTADKEAITWEVTADNADEIYGKLMARGITNLAGIQEAFSKGDVDFVNWVVSKQLAAERILGDLASELRMLTKNDAVRMNEIIDSMAYISKVSQQLGSAYGRGLNIQKFVNKARSIFATSTLSELGLDRLADIITMTTKNLDFTRSSVDIKKELYQVLVDNIDNNLFTEIIQDAAKREKLDGYFDIIIKNKYTNQDDIRKVLIDFITPIRMEKIKKLIESTPEQKNLPKMLNGLSSNGDIGAYVVHNLLSSNGTTIANVLSGVANTIAFPMEKIISGILAGNTELGRGLIKEGWHTYKAAADGLVEALRLGFQAFKTGDGKMIALGKTSVIDADTDLFQGFANINSTFDNPFSFIKNLHSMYTRIMGASDEMLTQLNYRAIARGKYLAEAEQLAESIGRADDKEFIQQMADKRFANSIDKNGRPLDTEVFAEARDIVYQTPLSGKYWNEQTQSYDAIKAQSWTMSVAESLTQLTNRIPILKVFIPFIRTPANIMQQNLEHNVFYDVLSPSQRELIFGKNVNPKQQALARAKMATGTMSVMVGTALFTMGRITGASPVDRDTREALYKTGWQPYSIKVGDKYYSYARIEPLASFLGFGANLGFITSSIYGDEDRAENIGNYVLESAKAVFDGTFNKTTFGALAEQYNTFMDVLNGEASWDKLAVYAQPFLPMVGGVRELSTGLRTTEQTQPKSAHDILFNKYFNEGLGDYRRNCFGERQDVFNAIISTGKSTTGSDIEDEELKRLAELGFSPSELTNSEYDSSIKYKDFKDSATGRSFYDAMMEEMSEIELNGQTLREAVRELIESDEYNKVPDGIGSKWNGQKDTKKVYLQALFNDYKKAAKAEVIDKYGEDYVNKDGLTANEQREQDRQEIEQKRLEASLNQTLEDIRSFN